MPDKELIKIVKEIERDLNIIEFFGRPEMLDERGFKTVVLIA